MAALTLKPLSTQGAFELVEEDGDTIGFGMARVSKAVPGYITLVTHEAPFGYAIRVPINWIDTLQGLPGAEDEVSNRPDAKNSGGAKHDKSR